MTFFSPSAVNDKINSFFYKIILTVHFHLVFDLNKNKRIYIHKYILTVQFHLEIDLNKNKKMYFYNLILTVEVCYKIAE